MLNAQTAKARVLSGIAPDGTICGIEPGDVQRTQRSLAQHIPRKFSRRMTFTIAVLDCDGKLILAVDAERDRKVPLHEYHDRALIQERSENWRLDLSDKRQLLSRRDRDQHRGPWRCDRCGALAGQFFGFVSTGESLRRSYKCDCGGEYWPAT